MDVAQAQTFIAVANAGSFVSAADSMHLTQTAVSARIKALEDALGCKLVLRSRGGIRLTQAGSTFLDYAASFVQTWERARQSVATMPKARSMIVMGAELCLWRPLLLNWLIHMNRRSPNYAVEVQVAPADRVLDKLQLGTLDMGVLYAPEARVGIEVQLLLEEELIAVSTKPDSAQIGDEGYVFVDWGEEFRSNHERAFPHAEKQLSFSGFGPLALRYILAVGGSGYFRRRAVQPYLEKGALHPIPGTPAFSHSIYLAVSRNTEPEIAADVRESLAQAAKMEPQDWG